MSIIYALTYGEYSEYTILGVYSTLELATRAQELHVDSNIEKYELDKLGPDVPGKLPYVVDIDFNGNVKYCDRHNSFGPNIKCQLYVNSVRFYIWATDEDEAIKIASEKRARLVAGEDFQEEVNLYLQKLNNHIIQYKEELSRKISGSKKYNSIAGTLEQLESDKAALLSLVTVHSLNNV